VSEGRSQPSANGLDDLYRRYAPWLRARVQRRYGAEAEDIVQDAWLRVARFGALDAIRHPRAFLLRVASNVALSQERRRLVSERHAAQEPAVDRSDAEQLEIVVLKEVILGLPQPLRDVFLLSRVAGLSNAQIAERLGIGLKTVEWRMTRALAHCASQLRR
jgi:RNA polymerase sigma factor (sigma-70 family)